MSTNAPRPEERPILGESWVVASSQPKEEEQTILQTASPSKTNTSEHSPRPKSEKRSKDRNGSDSLATSASSLSGPELIMPSIYEAPISEGSWVAPVVRSKGQLKQRHQRPTQETKRDSQAYTTTPKKDQDQPTASNTSRKTSASSPQSTSQLLTTLRHVLNALLILAIAHLLILPELTQQYQSLCNIPAIPTLYPTSCTPRFPQPPTPQQPHDPIQNAQASLEILFNTTLQEMSPLSPSLKQAESKLRAVQSALKAAYPGTKHELDLEFDGCWTATRTAAWKFDSLQADIRSAVDNLVVTGAASAASSDNGAQPSDVRLSLTQMSRREQYLDQLTARMQSKAEALSNDLARLDDHIKSIDAIVNRETGRTPPTGSPGPSGSIKSLLNSIIPGRALGTFLSFTDSNQEIPAPSSLLKTFREAAAQHEPVSIVVDNLSYRLHAYQQKKGNII
ncbi:hypothetical protein P168DRAFT_287262 [Aspergillus campestris IBT 28561]|uniref:Uncharacterized protein n=1 Tax=Aspergillus campestris (strain IBT 28561) TaxID=1392248 RepID=A0A2I1DH48_ASPC2|nr:uncharacterized protein P168DRAFT_287262 [Aspergillus campestris IBT 28561]PKY09195.1 hypothetical protein P168DRAFT_287262 [Aspergillus campestris IBT 28561]